MLRREKNGDGHYKYSLDISAVLTVITILISIFIFSSGQSDKYNKAIATNEKCIAENKKDIENNKESLREVKGTLTEIRNDVKILISK